jgi:hypothetical protein
MAQYPRPEPSDGFAARVAARFKARISRRIVLRRTIIWSGAAALSLAASLLLMISLRAPTLSRGPDAGQLARQAAPNPLETDLVRDVETAYLALARNAAGIWSPAEGARNELATATEIRELPTPPVAKAFRGSTNVIVTGSRGIGTSIRPVADSATGAFAFLWNDLYEPEENPAQ